MKMSYRTGTHSSAQMLFTQPGVSIWNQSKKKKKKNGTTKKKKQTQKYKDYCQHTGIYIYMYIYNQKTFLGYFVNIVI
jgi:hypothetical protein